LKNEEEPRIAHLHFRLLRCEQGPSVRRHQANPYCDTSKGSIKYCHKGRGTVLLGFLNSTCLICQLIICSFESHQLHVTLEYVFERRMDMLEKFRTHSFEQPLFCPCSLTPSCRSDGDVPSAVRLGFELHLDRAEGPKKFSYYAQLQDIHSSSSHNVYRLQSLGAGRACPTPCKPLVTRQTSG